MKPYQERVAREPASYETSGYKMPHRGGDNELKGGKEGDWMDIRRNIILGSRKAILGAPRTKYTRHIWGMPRTSVPQNDFREGWGRMEHPWRLRAGWQGGQGHGMRIPRINPRLDLEELVFGTFQAIVFSVRGHTDGCVEDRIKGDKVEMDKQFWRSPR